MIELLVITAIIGILSIGLASYLYQQNRLLNFSEKRDAMNKLMTGVVNASGNAEVLIQTENLQVP